MSRCLGCDSDKGKGTYCDNCREKIANKQSKQAERKEMFKQVALAFITGDTNRALDYEKDFASTVERYTEAILTAAETFSKKETP